MQPVAKITLTVQLPKVKLPGQCLSTTEVIAKLKKKARPHHFKSLTVTKHTIEFIRLEGELNSKVAQDLVISKLNHLQLRVSSFADPLKVKCAPLKIGSTKYEWETYFRDNPKMDEKKAGYRPDTIHVTNLPVKFFGGSRPRTDVLLDVFGTFGDIKRFHIPLLDEIEMQSSGCFKKFSHSESLVFDAFIMYKDYVGFVRAMDALRGMKLVKKIREDDGREDLIEFDITVDFDKTKHLSDKAIRKRRLEKEYGIKNSAEVKNLKEETRKRREDYDERIKQLVQRKNQAISLLKLILEKVAAKEEAEQKEKEFEDQKQKESHEQQQQQEDVKVSVTKPENHKINETDKSETRDDNSRSSIKLKEKQLEKERLLAKEKQLHEELKNRTAEVTHKLALAPSVNKLPLRSIVAAPSLPDPSRKQTPPLTAPQHQTAKLSLRSIVNSNNSHNNTTEPSPRTGEHTHARTQPMYSDIESERMRHKSVKTINQNACTKRSVSPPKDVNNKRPVRQKIVFDRSPDRSGRSWKVAKLVITTHNDDFVDSD